MCRRLSVFLVCALWLCLSLSSAEAVLSITDWTPSFIPTSVNTTVTFFGSDLSTEIVSNSSLALNCDTGRPVEEDGLQLLQLISITSTRMVVLAFGDRPLKVIVCALVCLCCFGFSFLPCNDHKFEKDDDTQIPDVGVTVAVMQRPFCVGSSTFCDEGGGGADSVDLALVLGVALPLGALAVLGAVLCFCWLRQRRHRRRRLLQTHPSWRHKDFGSWTDLRSLTHERSRELKRNLSLAALMSRCYQEQTGTAGSSFSLRVGTTTGEKEQCDVEAAAGEGGGKLFSVCPADAEGGTMGQEGTHSHSTAFSLERKASAPLQFLEIRPEELERGQLLGTGSFGEVYLGSFLDTQVAIKRVALSQSGSIRERLMEIKGHIRAGGHPNVVRLLGACTSLQDSLLIVMEYADSGDLKQFLHEENHTLWEKLRVMHQVAGAMVFLHRVGIVHRDLKPENVLMDSLGGPKITDFGIASIHRMGEEDNPATTMHTIGGTSQYMAPECIEGLSYDSSVDVYSFGVMLNECMSGQRPYTEMTFNNQLQLLYRVMHEGIRPSLPKPHSCPNIIRKLIQDCWSGQRRGEGHRPSFGDIKRQLKELVDIGEQGLEDLMRCEQQSERQQEQQQQQQQQQQKEEDCWEEAEGKRSSDRGESPLIAGDGDGGSSSP